MLMSIPVWKTHNMGKEMFSSALCKVSSAYILLFRMYILDMETNATFRRDLLLRRSQIWKAIATDRNLRSIRTHFVHSISNLWSIT